jgi:ankyrin repeat protein
MEAAGAGRVASVKLLLAAGANPKVRDTFGNTAYDLALGQRRADVAELLSGKRVDPAFLKTGYKDLFAAIFAGNAARVRELLDAGADVDARIDAATPLEYAILGGQSEVVALLLERGADANRPGGEGRTPLMLAAQVGNREIARQLLARGSDRSARNVLGQTAADIARREGHTDTVTLLNSKVVPAAAPVS